MHGQIYGLEAGVLAVSNHPRVERELVALGAAHQVNPEALRELALVVAVQLARVRILLMAGPAIAAEILSTLVIFPPAVVGGIEHVRPRHQLVDVRDGDDAPLLFPARHSNPLDDIGRQRRARRDDQARLTRPGRPYCLGLDHAACSLVPESSSRMAAGPFDPAACLSASSLDYDSEHFRNFSASLFVTHPPTRFAR